MISAGANGVEGIAAGRIIAGLGAVGMSVLQSKVIADWFTGPRFMLGISASTAGYPIGVGLSQILVPGLSAGFGLGAAFLAGAAWMAISAVLFIAFYRAAPEMVGSPRGFSFPTGRECALLVIGGLIWTAYTGSYAGYLAYLPSLMSERGQSLALIALVATIATWGNVPGVFAGGGLANRFGAWRIFLFGSLCLVAGTVGAGALDWPVLFGILIGVPGCMQAGVIMAVGTLSARAEHRAAGMGVFYIVYYLGGAAIPAVCGWAADAYGGAEGAMFAAAAVGALAVPIYMLHRRLAGHEAMLARA